MSISKVIPQYSVLPFIFTQQLITTIERQVQTKEDLKSILTSYIPNFPPCKEIPIVKQEYFKNLIQKSPVQQLIINLYSFMTQNTFTIEEKTQTTNLVYKLIYFISQISMTKQKWKFISNRQVDNLSHRFNSPLTNPLSAEKYIPAVLTVYQAQSLREFINKEILAFYEIWQKILDQNQYLLIDSKCYEPVNQQKKFPGLSQGRKLEISELMGLELLKEYLSDKPPVQEKKDPKKK